MFDPSENEKDSAETSVTKNPLNGVGSSPEAVEEEDSEDLFVSTYEVESREFLFTFLLNRFYLHSRAFPPLLRLQSLPSQPRRPPWTI